jgi:hypothetical protein
MTASAILPLASISFQSENCISEGILLDQPDDQPKAVAAHSLISARQYFATMRSGLCYRNNVHSVRTLQGVLCIDLASATWASGAHLASLACSYNGDCDTSRQAFTATIASGQVPGWTRRKWDIDFGHT